MLFKTSIQSIPSHDGKYNAYVFESDILYDVYKSIKATAENKRCDHNLKNNKKLFFRKEVQTGFHFQQIGIRYLAILQEALSRGERQ